MRHDFIEDFRGAILDRANDTEQHTTGHPAPGTIASPRLAFETLVALDLAWAQGTQGQASALRFAPPACPRQSKAPEDRFILIEQNDLTLTSSVLQGGKFERRPRQLSGGGSKSPRGTTVTDVFF